jgi:hypothetical protein
LGGKVRKEREKVKVREKRRVELVHKATKGVRVRVNKKKVVAVVKKSKGSGVCLKRNKKRKMD